VVEVIQQSGTIGVHTHPPPPRARRLHAHGSASPQRAQRSSRPHLTVQHVPASLSPLDRDHTIGASRPSACASSEPRPHSGTTAEDSSTYDRPTPPGHHHSRRPTPHVSCPRIAKPSLPQSLPPSAPALPPSAAAAITRPRHQPFRPSPNTTQLLLKDESRSSDTHRILVNPYSMSAYSSDQVVDFVFLAAADSGRRSCR
jgi:hypothetical protein